MILSLRAILKIKNLKNIPENKEFLKNLRSENGRRTYYM